MPHSNPHSENVYCKRNCTQKIAAVTWGSSYWRFQVRYILHFVSDYYGYQHEMMIRRSERRTIYSKSTEMKEDRKKEKGRSPSQTSCCSVEMRIIILWVPYLNIPGGRFLKLMMPWCLCFPNGMPWFFVRKKKQFFKSERGGCRVSWDGSNALINYGDSSPCVLCTVLALRGTTRTRVRYR